MHISSLHSEYGIGDLGSCAENFMVFLKKAGFSIWQVLPVSPTNIAFGNSPYSSLSAFAGNELFISPDKLELLGLISKEELCCYEVGNYRNINYHKVSLAKEKIYKIAWENFKKYPQKHNELHKLFEKFKETESFWLHDYAFFMLLREINNNECWNKWQNYNIYNKNVLKNLLLENSNIDKYNFTCFKQFVFYKQLYELKEKAKDIGISLIGDIPMFVSFDSSDLWSNRELFDLTEDGTPKFVAGVPPDYFSRMGQRWGNPLYDWQKMRRDNFNWWINRVSHQLKYFDIIRIDHFRGFSACWKIPEASDTAINGEWEKTLGDEMLKILFEQIGNPRKKTKIIAEDLGIITEEVNFLRNKYNLPGMKILQFAFGDDMEKNPYLPHNIEENSIVYSGTHDNNTTVGWWEKDSTQYERDNFLKYTNSEKSDNIVEKMNSLVLSSKSKIAIITMQDLFSLDSSARMNIPGKKEDNWTWSLTKEETQILEQNVSKQAEKYLMLNKKYNRQ